MPRAVRRRLSEPTANGTQAAWIRHLFSLFSERRGPRPRSSSSHCSGVRGNLSDALPTSRRCRRLGLWRVGATAPLALHNRREGIAAATLQRFVHKPPAIPRRASVPCQQSQATAGVVLGTQPSALRSNARRPEVRWSRANSLSQRAGTDPRMRSPLDPAEEAAAAVEGAGHVNKEAKQLAPTLPARSNAHSGGLRPRAASCGCSR
jgi:hypothetical protein